MKIGNDKLLTNKMRIMLSRFQRCIALRDKLSAAFVLAVTVLKTLWHQFWHSEKDVSRSIHLIRTG